MDDQAACNFWRSAYEGYAAIAWFALAALTAQSLSAAQLPFALLWGVFCVAGALGIWRLLQALNVWRHRHALEDRTLRWLSTDELYAKMIAKPNHIWLGWGFEWTRVHAQRLYDLERLDHDRLRVPFLRFWRQLRGCAASKGSALLHGVQPVEKDIYVPISDIQGHVFVPATTGAIKTRLLALMAVQAIRRAPYEAVIVIDPKGDAQLRDLLRAECIAAGRPNDFAYFHPAFPSESVRIDPLANWTRATEVASRIAALMPSESGNDPWSAFGWRVLHLVVEGCVISHGRRPTLTTIRRYVEGGVDQLLHTTLVKHLEDKGIEWRVAIEPYLRNISRYSRQGATANPETSALVALYKHEHQQPTSIGPVDGLISMYEHNREHSQKMLASLIPILTTLTAGDLAGLLSPDRSDTRDPRPVLNGASIVESGAVVYMGLDALSDAVVASAIASICMADLTAHAGLRYNLGLQTPSINIFVDEANECVNSSFVQMLNKARGAGYKVVFFSQTFSDFEAKLGSSALARQVLGNANSIIAGRTKDKVTSEYVMEDFGETVLMATQYNNMTSTVADGKLLHYTGSYGERKSETVSEIVPPEALGRLPDLEYFATFSGSTLIKGRIPLLRREPSTKSPSRKGWFGRRIRSVLRPLAAEGSPKAASRRCA